MPIKQSNKRMKIIFGLLFGALAYFGLEIAFNFSPIGFLLGKWRTLDSDELIIPRIVFTLAAIVVGIMFEGKVRDCKTKRNAFLYGGLITAITSFISGPVIVVLQHSPARELILLAPFMFLAMDVFLVSPFIFGGLLAIAWWSYLNRHNKSLQSDA